MNEFPTVEELRRLADLRTHLFDAIAFELHTGGGAKAYEGTFELHFPNYWETRDQDPRFSIVLHCYAVGPSRHYTWSGRTWASALNKCESDVQQWISETYAFVDDVD
jgi:hypothetical protein